MIELTKITDTVDIYAQIIVYATLKLIKAERAEEYKICSKINNYIPKIINDCIDELKTYGDVPFEVYDEIHNVKGYIYGALSELPNDELQTLLEVSQEIVDDIKKKKNKI